MKHIEIKNLLKRDLLVVELPEGARDLKLFSDIGRPYVSYFYEKCETGRYYFDGDLWNYLGQADEIREEDAEQLVEKVKDYHMDDFELMLVGNATIITKINKRLIVYKSYMNNNKGFSTATESLLSAIETVVFWENPLGDEPIFSDFSGLKVMNEPKEWERIQAQSRTFDRSRTLIFVKN